MFGEECRTAKDWLPVGAANEVPEQGRAEAIESARKDEAEDLTADEKKIFKSLVLQIKGELR